ncbi:Lrp/AsnC family transcriptional regulator [Thalassotalea litorea]|uniref:Lrp/AsnC family transcriptional regulator n=1 Tax=Thalassotalea litorea TaxID=2020715 RepID=A0A5R9II66_9GAMM|nr:Lrp/AsnC family transcriptional regulator [Thalassotalea litorea]TLU64153.1 Lrp/AsnC family transcriptional regulator [Thalassotalea litorea]
MKKTIKIDSYNKKILATLHLQADLTNVELAAKVNLSPSACFQRVKSLKEAGYFRTFHADVNLEQICEHVLAYIEFTLADNSAPVCRKFAAAIDEIPQIMDCMRMSGEVDFISLCCFSDIKALNEACDRLSDKSELCIKRIKTRIVLDRTKFFLGYPLAHLKWFDENTQMDDS